MSSLSNTEQRVLFELYDIPNIAQLRNPSIARNVLSSISNQLQDLQHCDWEKRLALLQILEIIHNESLHVRSLSKTLLKLIRKNKAVATLVADGLVVQITDRRSEITKQLSSTIITMAKALKHDMINILVILFAPILERIKIGNSLIRKHFTEAIKEILIEVHDKYLIHDIYHQFEETKSVDVQHELAKLMKCVLVQWDIKWMIKNDIMKNLNKPVMRLNIEDFITKCINHKIAVTRNLGIDLFWIYILNYYIDYQDVFLSRFDERIQKLVADNRPNFYVEHKKSIFHRVSTLFQDRAARINSKYKGSLADLNEKQQQASEENVDEIQLEISEQNQEIPKDQTSSDKLQSESSPDIENKITDGVYDSQLSKNENIQRKPCCVCYC